MPTVELSGTRVNKCKSRSFLEIYRIAEGASVRQQVKGDLLVGLLALDALLGLPFPLHCIFPAPFSILLPDSHQQHLISQCVNQSFILQPTQPWAAHQHSTA